MQPAMTARAALVVIAVGAAVLLASGSPAVDAAIVPTPTPERFELEFWRSIKDSEDPEDYEAYLEAYPEGRFAPLAKRRAKSLREKEAQAPARAAVSVDIEEMDREYEVLRNASLREGPTSSSERLGTVAGGTRVIVTGRVVDGKWFRVETLDGESGFVFGKLLREIEPTAAATQSAAPSAPKKAPEAQARKQAAPSPTKKKSPKQKQPSPTKKKYPKQKQQVAKAEPAPSPSAVPQPADELRTFTDCEGCPEMVVIPPGRFVMGTDGGVPNEAPAHRVKIDYPFAIGRYEVTWAQWKRCVDAGGCDYMPDMEGMSADAPVHHLSWADAQQYVRWLSKKTGKEYRLPSEAEWEYAARGGTSTKYWWGDKPGKGKANCKGCGDPWDKKHPAEVDAFAPNPFGLYGMSGGVWEWASDCWFNDHEGAPKDGRPRDRSNCIKRVIRGGSWRNDPSYVHSASRFNYDANVRYSVHGFRVARKM